MSTISYSELRQRIAATIEALSGWRESKARFEQFAIHPDSYADQTFAVGLTRSAGDGREPQKSTKLNRGALTSTEVLVRFSRINRPKDQVVAGDESLDAEDDVRKAVMGVSRLGGLHIRWEGAERDLSSDTKWHVATLTFTAIHRIDLE